MRVAQDDKERTSESLVPLTSSLSKIGRTGHVEENSIWNLPTVTVEDSLLHEPCKSTHQVCTVRLAHLETE